MSKFKIDLNTLEIGLIEGMLDNLKTFLELKQGILVHTFTYHSLKSLSSHLEKIEEIIEEIKNFNEELIEKFDKENRKKLGRVKGK